MSGPDRWMEQAKSVWESWRVHLVRLTPGPKVTPEQLQSSDALARWRAVRALTGRPAPDLLPELIRLAGDEDELVRAAAVDTLVSWGPAVVLVPVREALAAQPAPAVAVSLLGILARLPDSTHRAVIQPWLDADEPEVRAGAFMALAALCDDADLPLLEDALAEEDIRVQRAIMATLCAPEAGPLAAKAATTSDPIQRQRAVQAGPRIQRHLEAQRQADARAKKKQSAAESQSAAAEKSPEKSP